MLNAETFSHNIDFYVVHDEHFSFYWRRFRRSSFLNVKNMTFTPYCVCVCVWCVCVCGGGGQDVITIQTSTMTPLSATVSRVSTGVGGWGRGYKCSLLSQRVLVYACAK